MLEIHPSWDVNDIYMKQDGGPAGAETVTMELDEFNARYQYLLDALYGRLQDIARMNPNDIVTLVSVFICYV